MIESGSRHADGVGGAIAGKLHRVVAALALLGAVWVASSCGSSDEPVDVFAAASLVDAFGEVATAFTEESGVEVRLNFAGSSILREQILDGASVDVFASANSVVMEAAAAGRAGFGPRATMAVNELVLAVPAGNARNVNSIQDLADPGLFVGVCAASVPCGDLAQDYFAQAGVTASVDTFDPDVRFVVSRLLDEELDAGMVYRSDVVATNGALTIVERAEPPIVTSYPIAVVEPADDDAQAFVDFVLGDAGQAILERWGFVAP